jgi:phage terminase large subunit
VTHRRAGKTVACIHDLQRRAVKCPLVRPRFAYLSPFLRQSKSVAWDYLRAAMAVARPAGATVHESELRVDYPRGGQIRLYGADNPDALRGIYLDGIVLDEYADMDPRVWSEITGRRLPIGRAGRCSSARRRDATPSSSCGGARSGRRAGSP